LRIHGERTSFPRRTGLYTSPHLIRPEERIRINFKSLSRELFAKYFFEVYDGLSEQFSKDDSKNAPRYLQLFALVSFHTFIRERVDAAIYETHNGGEYDATNVIQRPIVTAITTLGMDHVKQLGPSLENIAWHKGGIFKRHAPAFSSIQEPTAAAVLKSRAAEKGVELEFVGVDPALPINVVQLKPEVQRTNCSLALAAVNAFLQQKVPGPHQSLISSDILRAIEQFTWPGRFQLIVDGNCQWFLDGAHNEMSVKRAAQWFAEASSETQRYSVMSGPVTDH
jgi:folylpolyglutamate synthase